MAGLAKWVYTGILAAALGFLALVLAFSPGLRDFLFAQVGLALLGLGLWLGAVVCFIAGLVAVWRKPKGAAPTGQTP